MIYVLSYVEAKANEPFIDHCISINDHNPEPVFRVHGKKSTLYLNFNDVWYNEDGKKCIWSGTKEFVLDDEIAKKTPVPSNFILNIVDGFINNNPDFFSEENNSVIHCWAGVSRSSSILLYILMKSGLSFDEAINKVLSVRPFARPNLVLAGHMENIFGVPIVDSLKCRLNYKEIS